MFQNVILGYKYNVINLNLLCNFTNMKGVNMFNQAGIIMTLVLGALAGWIASMIMGKDSQMGGVANIIVGIIGSVIGGWIYDAFFLKGSAPSTFTQVLWAVIGAVILLWIINLITNKSKKGNTKKRF